ncbi:MAG: hypothetical protein KAT70_08670 [Thermoplasmata archaeon]|nr:hypothetical protein [Thermoplasmata archaeon]
MKSIAVITEDFRLYHSLVKALKDGRVPFITLPLDDPIPLDVGVVLTSPEEKTLVQHKAVVAVEDDNGLAIDKAQHVLSGKGCYDKLDIGVDPGPRPGVAVVGDGELLKTTQLETPEAVASIVENILAAFPSRKILVRIGHGDPVMRNRIINSLSRFAISLEVVDESNTSKHVEHPHEDAAIAIAYSHDTILHLDGEKLPVEPTEGEIRDLQRRSRIESGGRRTISREEARRVARGERTMEEAISERNDDAEG